MGAHKIQYFNPLIVLVYRKTLSHQRETNSRADKYNSHHEYWEEAIYKNKNAKWQN